MECEGEESCERAEPSRPRQTNSKADRAGSRTGQELAQCHQIGICAFAQPLSPRHQLVPEIAQMCDRSTEGGEPQLQECAEYLGDASLRLLRAMIHSRDLVGWGILASDDVRSARDRFSGCSRQIDPRSEEHTSELQSLMRITNAACC